MKVVHINHDFGKFEKDCQELLERLTKKDEKRAYKKLFQQGIDKKKIEQPTQEVKEKTNLKEPSTKKIQKQPSAHFKSRPSRRSNLRCIQQVNAQVGLIPVLRFNKKDLT